MNTIQTAYLAALREELARTSDPRTVADLTAEITRLEARLDDRRSVPGAVTR